MPDSRTDPRPTSPPPVPDPAPGVFLQALLRSQLLDRPRLDALLAAAPPAVRASARALADHLVEAGELTHYQVEKLLKGRWGGFVLGPYQVLAPLGRGGMGTVYLARDVRTPGGRVVATGRGGEEEARRGGVEEKGRGGDRAGDNPSPPLPLSPSPHLLALKVLPPKRAREEERTLLRFRREMELGRHLDHPNVTRTFDAGEVGGVHYIAMEYVPGQSLRQLVAAGGPLPVADASRVFVDVAAGLAHAHARGLIHRDLKPPNIMVTPDGRAKLLDLGLALLVGEQLPDDPAVVGGRGYILGTMDYIAPEQAANATDVGPRSDLYALGCSLFFAVTGMPPFPGGTSQQKMRWHRTTEPPRADTINPAVPAEFARLIERLMAKRPDDRPESADAVRELLLPWAGERVTRAGAGPAPHTDREAVAEFDRRAFDPSLWDEVPAAELAELLPLEDATGEVRPHPFIESLRRIPRPVQIGYLVVVAVLLLVILVGVLRRL